MMQEEKQGNALVNGQYAAGLFVVQNGNEINNLGVAVWEKVRVPFLHKFDLKPGDSVKIFLSDLVYSQIQFVNLNLITDGGEYILVFDNKRIDIKGQTIETDREYRNVSQIEWVTRNAKITCSFKLELHVNDKRVI